MLFFLGLLLLCEVDEGNDGGVGGRNEDDGCDNLLLSSCCFCALLFLLLILLLFDGTPSLGIDDDVPSALCVDDSVSPLDSNDFSSVCLFSSIDGCVGKSSNLTTST